MQEDPVVASLNVDLIIRKFLLTGLRKNLGQKRKTAAHESQPRRL
jgi:hypothetical protein